MPNGDEKRFVEGLGEVTFGKLIEEYATERQRVIDARRERNTAQTESERVSREFALFKEDVARELETLRNRNEEEKAQHQDFLRSLANKLGTPQKKPEILEALDTLIANEDKADQYQRANKELEEKIVKLNKKITEFENGSPLTAYGRWRAFIYALTGR